MGSGTSPLGDSKRKCESLSPAEADEIFFPGRGKKPFRARAFCFDCPFISQCLTEAIELDVPGFWAGTSEQERRSMRGIHYSGKLALFNLMPPEPDPTARPIYLKVFTSEDPRKWMDEVEPTEEELLAM